MEFNFIAQLLENNQYDFSEYNDEDRINENRLFKHFLDFNQYLYFCGIYWHKKNGLIKEELKVIHRLLSDSKALFIFEFEPFPSDRNLYGNAEQVFNVLDASLENTVWI